ncbi:hypothetical protein JW805_06365 [Roseomonas aeriglobus]|nr:hypothetical protein [Roseomonas aeriglobus]
MADTPKTPAPPPRRKAATGTRKTTRTATPRATKTPAAAKDEGETAATAAPKPARKAPAKRASTGSSRRTTAAAKPTAATSATTAAKSAATKVSRQATKAAETVSDAASSARRSVAQSAPAQKVSETRDKMGDRNFFAALIGGAAAIAATVGGILYAVRDGKPVSAKDKTDA